MDCAVCAAANPDASKFCGACGTILDASGARLRQQIVGVIERDFRNSELVAVQIADKAEERLWRWGKLLGFAFATFLVGIGSFGFTSYKEARKTISDAAQAAVTSLNHTADQSRQTIIGKGAETIAQMQRAEAVSISQIQSQTKTADTQVAAVVTRAKISSSRLEQAETSVSALQARVTPLERNLSALERLKEASPDTPIGTVNSGLFSSFGYGSLTSPTYGASVATYQPLQAQTGWPNNFGRSDFSPIVTLKQPYKIGDTGEGVKALQNRLAELLCSDRKATGSFDSDTSAAVVAFVTKNGRPSRYSLVGLIDPTTYAPTLLSNDETPGTVDYQLWASIFSTTAKLCK